MGFMDKAKKMAEQAQAKLDEAQKNFNASQQHGQGPSGPVVEYDKHGRPITPAGDPDGPGPQPPAAPMPSAHPDTEAVPPQAATPLSPSDDPLQPAAPADKAAQFPHPAGDEEKPHGDPLADADRETPRPAAPPSGSNPGMSSGDPLAG
jgi:hypothetical protein